MNIDDDFFGRSWSEEDFAPPRRASGSRSEKNDLNRILSGVATPITVELGTIGLTAADLLYIEAGMVLEIAVTPDYEVTLRLGLDRIARGRLILVGEKLAVEVMESENSVNGGWPEDENSRDASIQIADRVEVKR